MFPPLKPFVTGKPFEIVAADTLEMSTSLSGMKYVLVVVDHFSKWLIREEVRAKNEKYIAKMKEVYDKRKNMDVLSPPAEGGKVFMKLPHEKARGKHLKLTRDWDRPYRVLQTDESSALITTKGSNEDAIKV
nr:hypothetical protein HCOI_01723700 [Haemonchus contortus]